MKILYEDEAMVVLDKPAGVIVHPAPGHEHGALTEWFVAHCPAAAHVGSAARPGVVHRLDIGTSGVMVFAKTQAAYLALRRTFETHAKLRKTYLAVLHGAPKTRAGTCETPVGRDPRPAVSHWRVLGRQGSLALVEFVIETGRMHQIRLHARALGHPVVGDELYGDAARDRQLKVPPGRPLLHAVALSFPHPIHGEPMTFTAPPPPELVYVH